MTEMEEMQRAVICLAIEVPGSVHGDVNDKWEAVKEYVTAQDARYRRAVDMLTAIQWSGYHRPTASVYCPQCNHTAIAGHAMDCSLAAVLAESEEPLNKGE